MKIMGLLAAASVIAIFTGAATAADLIINEQDAPVYDAPATSDWTGPYIGINAGVAFGIPHASTTDDECDWWCGPGIVEYPGGGWPGSDPLSDDHNFFPFAGVQAGFNYQLENNVVIGIEGDIQASLGDLGNNDDDPDPMQSAELIWPGPSSFDITPNIDWWGTLRGRAGVLVQPETLIYVTGGLAFAHTNMDDAWWLPDDFATEDTRFGYAVGAGVEQQFTESISGKLEYLFVNLGDQGDTTPFEDGDFNSDLAFHAVRAGLNFHF